MLKLVQPNKTNPRHISGKNLQFHFTASWLRPPIMCSATYPLAASGFFMFLCDPTTELTPFGHVTYVLVNQDLYTSRRSWPRGRCRHVGPHMLHPLNGMNKLSNCHHPACQSTRSNDQRKQQGSHAVVMASLRFTPNLSVRSTGLSR